MITKKQFLNFKNINNLYIIKTKNYYYLYKDNNKIGFVKFFYFEPNDYKNGDKKSIKIERLFLESEFRGNGYGGLFLKYLQNKYENIILDILADHLYNFYEKNGFVCAGGKEEYGFSRSEIDEQYLKEITKVIKNNNIDLNLKEKETPLLN